MRPLLLSVLLLGACYDPDLGEHPFRCGTSDPKCPDGYSCDESTNVCERGGGGDSPDANGNNLECNDDSQIEPNDLTSNAFSTPIPDSADCMSLVQLAICPSTDKDLYRFRVDVNGKELRTVVTADLAAGQLTLRVLNGSGNAIASGLPVDSTHIEIIVHNLATGSYFVEVGAPAEVENNYALDIITCDISGCPGVTCS